MNTYKIPALGLEIQADDIKKEQFFADWERESLEWRFPTREEIKILLDLSDTLGILGLTKAKGKAYIYKDFETETFYQIKTVKNDWENLSESRIRFVRDI